MRVTIALIIPRRTTIFQCLQTRGMNAPIAADWKNRAAGQPFFAVFNYIGTHESQIWAENHAATCGDTASG